MKNKFTLFKKETATAALEDAKNFGIKASLEEKDGAFQISFESKASFLGEKAESSPSPTWDDYYAFRDNIYAEMQYQMKWVMEEISYLQREFYKHSGDGHLPPILDASIMKKALKALGLEDSFEVRKPFVHVQY